MFKKNLLIGLATLLAFFQLTPAFADNTKPVDSAKTLETAQAFLWAAGSGDMKKLQSLMADDFVWHNEGD
ncbi:MAG: nuclear transport factor 2 family protein, partial [Marinomonas sp.]